jgi:hypothetical protein
VTTPAVAPFVTTYATHTPYLTPDEWLAAPTAIDTKDLITGGSPAQQRQVIVNKIESASSWVDRICFKSPTGCLAATTDTTSNKRFLVNRYGTIKIPLPFRPILEVSAVMVGRTPSTMFALSSLADVDISSHGVIEVPVAGAYNRAYGYGGIGVGSRPLARVTWTNGFPNTTLAAASAAAATSITLASVLGIYPGTGLTLYDTTGGNDHVTVAPSFVPGATTVPLSAPTVFAHAAGVSVSNLPARVKEATILLTSALIQTRGDDAIVLESMDTPSKMSAAYGANADAEQLATVLLGDLVRAV